jgi:hypothetical protein
MDLGTLILSPCQVSQWYPKSLVLIKLPVSQAKEEPLRHLGDHERQILLLVRDPENVYLEEKAFQFLLSILNACGLSMTAIALVNTARTGTRSLPSIVSELGSQTILLFGIDKEELGLPIVFPSYQVQSFAGKTYLGADSLSLIEQDRHQKGLLWTSLKQLFQR